MSAPLRHLRTRARLRVLVALLAIGMLVMVTLRGELLLWHLRWYLPVHTTMEIFSVVVAMLIFSTGWHSVDGRVQVRVALLSPAALAVGLFDLAHLMWVPGMPGLDGSRTSLRGIEFWLFARSIGALALLAAAIAPPGIAGKRLHRGGVALALAFVAAGYALVLFAPGLLPATYKPGVGITGFKQGWEFAVTLVCCIAAVLLVRRVRRSPGRVDARTDTYLAAAAAILALGEINFTLYHGADDWFNTIGHVYKVVAYLCLYRAIYVEVVQAPYVRLRASERSLAASETKFRSLMECAPDAILLAGREGRIAMMNARAEELFGIARERVTGLPLDLLVPPGADDADVVCRHSRSGEFPAEVRRALTPSGQQIAIVRDVSERRQLEGALLEQLTCDALTGLPNRRRILEMLGEAIGAARGDGRVLAVLVLDIDEFRKVNSGYGYAGGDGVLREGVARLSRHLGAGDTLARQGGNEFIIVQRDSGQVQAGVLADTLLDAMLEPFLLDGQQLYLSASIGIALLPPKECAPYDLLQMAQVAMAAARMDGRARWRFHTAAMAEEIRTRVDMEALLRYAFERGEFALQYQPRISVDTGRIVGAEALVRWRHPALGVMAPGHFIPLLEETGMIEQLDLWVLGEACERAAGWRAQGLPPMRVSVNLSARQFQQAGLALRVRAALEKSGLPPACLELEITESTVMRDTEEAAGVLRSLKALGVGLSIDDFGTGYSSLSYLKRFPLDVLKIDRSFVADVIHDPNDASITRAIIALAHSLNLEAVAEGVETREQAEFLKENGCDEIQGYYFSRPVWPEEMAQMLATDAVAAK
jgi:diguanylate cyclase (GGDEF)-like protein/PAS domain S-box-containing protein